MLARVWPGLVVGRAARIGRRIVPRTATETTSTSAPSGSTAMAMPSRAMRFASDRQKPLTLLARLAVWPQYVTIISWKLPARSFCWTSHRPVQEGTLRRNGGAVRQQPWSTTSPPAALPAQRVRSGPAIQDNAAASVALTLSSPPNTSSTSSRPSVMVNAAGERHQREEQRFHQPTYERAHGNTKQRKTMSLDRPCDPTARSDARSERLRLPVLVTRLSTEPLERRAV